MKKKFLLIALAAMAVGFVSCKNEGNNDPEDTTPKIPGVTDNVIAYTAGAKLDNTSLAPGSGLEQFGATIIYHEFADGKGTITFNGKITVLGDRAFYLCEGMTSVEVPNTVTQIKESAFEKCTDLKSVNIPERVTDIYDDAFLGCSSLESVNLGVGVRWLGESAFENCTGLKSVTSQSETPPSCSDYVFSGVDKSIPVYVPAESVEAYKEADEWSDFKNFRAIE